MTREQLLRRFLAMGVVFAAGVLAGLLMPKWLNVPSQATAQTNQPAGPHPSPPPVSGEGKGGGRGAEERLKQLKIELPPPSKSSNTLVMAVRVGDMLYVSGHGPNLPGVKSVLGKLGQDLDVKQGKEAARRVGLNILSTVRAELGSLDKVERVVKTLGMVSATPDFTQHPQVINGFSDLMVEVFGDKAGKGARSAVGMSSLPSNIPVEIEVIFQVKK